MDLKLFTACLLVVVSYAAAKSTHREYIDLTISNICIAILLAISSRESQSFVVKLWLTIKHLRLLIVLRH